MQMVQAAVFAPLWQEYTYLWPDHLGKPRLGLRITVPFGQSKRVAVVTGLHALESSDDSAMLKDVIDRLDDKPIFNALRRRWIERCAAYQLCTLGEMYETASAWAAIDKHRQFRCNQPDELLVADASLGRAFTTKRAISLSTIAQHSQLADVQWRALQAVKSGLLEEVLLAPKKLPETQYQAISLRPSQQSAVQAISDQKNQFTPLLLFGCTGSGKTEVYLQAAEQCVAEGKQVLILVPEIGLTPMWLNRLSARFSEIGIWHSGLTHREKNHLRSRLSSVQILLGTRSALFLPLPNLALMVIDEEHDSSFKQQDGVQYSARDLSMLLAQELKIPLVLGSATPSLESWRQVQMESMQCFKLSERVYEHTAITPEIVDMRGSHDVFSPAMLERIIACHARGEQIMLYLNRRGYAPALQCTACGDVPKCPSCSVRLTLHRQAGMLRCHTCDYAKRVNLTCQQCGEKAYLPLGSGTERLEEDLQKAIPTLRLARFDRDVIKNAKDLTEVLSAFEAGDIDCLVGTQMLVKGHHFPNVTLVGVINADLGMNLPDFRASERWWQQMTQVFGRTGRGEKAGHVVVQTWSPDAPWFEKLDEQKAEDVLNEELSLREWTKFPPYARWVRIVFSSLAQQKALQAAKLFAERLVAWDAVKVSGPLPCAMERVANRYRFELIVRDETRRHLPWQLLPLLKLMRVPSGVRRKVDVDPLDLM